MYKTTLYLPEEDIQRLKTLAAKTPKKGLTYHFRSALKLYLKTSSQSPKKKFTALVRCRGSAGKHWIEDAVSYQRKLREEWE